MKMTQNERRRMYLAQQAARQAMLDRLKQPVAVDTAVDASAVRRRWLKTVAIATLIGSGLLAYQQNRIRAPGRLALAARGRMVGAVVEQRKGVECHCPCARCDGTADATV